MRNKKDIGKTIRSENRTRKNSANELDGKSPSTSEKVARYVAIIVGLFAVIGLGGLYNVYSLIKTAVAEPGSDVLFSRMHEKQYEYSVFTLAPAKYRKIPFGIVSGNQIICYDCAITNSSKNDIKINSIDIEVNHLEEVGEFLIFDPYVGKGGETNYQWYYSEIQPVKQVFTAEYKGEVITELTEFVDNINLQKNEDGKALKYVRIEPTQLESFYINIKPTEPGIYYARIKIKYTYGEGVLSYESEELCFAMVTQEQYNNTVVIDLRLVDDEMWYVENDDEFVENMRSLGYLK
jgi:hypothetical protein